MVDNTNSPCLLCMYYREFLKACPRPGNCSGRRGPGDQGDRNRVHMDRSGYNRADKCAGPKLAALVQIRPLPLAGCVTRLGK